MCRDIFYSAVLPGRCRTWVAYAPNRRRPINYRAPSVCVCVMCKYKSALKNAKKHHHKRRWNDERTKRKKKCNGEKKTKPTERSRVSPSAAGVRASPAEPCLAYLYRYRESISYITTI